MFDERWFPCIVNKKDLLADPPSSPAALTNSVKSLLRLCHIVLYRLIVVDVTTCLPINHIKHDDLIMVMVSLSPLPKFYFPEF